MPRRRLILVVLPVCAALVAGCGAVASDDTSDGLPAGDQRAVARVIEELEKAANRAAPDTDRICSDLFTPALARRISARDPGENCSQALKDPLADARSSGSEGYRLTVRRVRVRGSRATASVFNDGGSDRRLTSDYGLVKGSDGAWRIASF